ncbi:hypothetical protein [Haliangium sp.]|uniref:hypothetical protein n=1 Tax=Haliangium sp. TaxID=2663208 RepID=UPI003D12FC27
MTETGRTSPRARLGWLASVFMLLLAWPAPSRADDSRTQIFIPTMPTLRSWQNILTMEGTGGLYLLADDDAQDIMRARDLGALALMRGARIRLTLGRNRLWAWTLTASGGGSTVVRTDQMTPDGIVTAREHQLRFGRLSGGAMLRHGDMRTLYLHADLGAQWMGHTARTRATSEHDVRHEFSAVSTVGVGYDLRLGEQALIGVNLTSSCIVLGTLRSHGLQSLDAGLRLGFAWL